MAQTSDHRDVSGTALNEHPKLEPPSVMAYVELSQYSFASRGTIWQSVLPSPSSTRSELSKVGPKRTANLKASARHLPYPKTPSTNKRRGVSFEAPSGDLPERDKRNAHQEAGAGGDEEEQGDDDIEDELESEDESDDGKLIPKPPGEAGRPGRGGYLIADKVKWDQKLYNKIEVCGKGHLTELLSAHTRLPGAYQESCGRYARLIAI